MPPSFPNCPLATQSSGIGRFALFDFEYYDFTNPAFDPWYTAWTRLPRVSTLELFCHLYPEFAELDTTSFTGMLVLREIQAMRDTGARLPLCTIDVKTMIRTAVRRDFKRNNPLKSE